MRMRMRILVMTGTAAGTSKVFARLLFLLLLMRGLHRSGRSRTQRRLMGQFRREGTKGFTVMRMNEATSTTFGMIFGRQLRNGTTGGNRSRHAFGPPGQPLLKG